MRRPRRKNSTRLKLCLDKSCASTSSCNAAAARWGAVWIKVGLPIPGIGREVVSGDNPVAATFIVGRHINPRINLGMSAEKVNSVVRRRKQILTFSPEQLKCAWFTLAEARQALNGRLHVCAVVAVVSTLIINV
jgi:hypothetical protein